MRSRTPRSYATSGSRRGRPRRASRAGWVTVLVLVVVVGLAAGGAWAAQRGGIVVVTVGAPPGPGRSSAPVPPAAPAPDPPTPSAPADATPAAEPTSSWPRRGTGRWLTATVRGAVAGQDGELLRYRVAVEEGIGDVDVERFGREVAVVLADPRGWTGQGRWRLQRVGPDTPADFTIMLATPVTRGELCGDITDHYTSCRNGDRVVINVARWARGVPEFEGDLTTYRRYLLNHEVGHRLGRGHELCPRAGGPAPVMQQQTLGLHGCAPNAWPEVSGALHTGPPGEYDDPVPAED